MDLDIVINLIMICLGGIIFLYCIYSLINFKLRQKMDITLTGPIICPECKTTNKMNDCPLEGTEKNGSC